uniref:Uncharacterized protein n=1 Tax=Pseudo-nitzschia australis TaxID=44445 RepID=A0A7S4EGN9_9STRA
MHAYTQIHDTNLKFDPTNNTTIDLLTHTFHITSHYVSLFVSIFQTNEIHDTILHACYSYGLPPLTKVPNGMKPLLEVYGKGKNRFPLLVQMCHPFTWVVQLPSNDVNGEDGTIQAGEYAKGDTATFFLYQDEGHVDNIGKADKGLFERALIKSISQKGANMYQNFKVIKAVPQTDNPAYNGKDYVLCDFKYELLTGAGFEVQRRGVAAITSEGPAVEVLWAASTTLRWSKTEETLRDIVSTFRVYSDGLNFSDEIAKNEERFALQYD